MKENKISKKRLIFNIIFLLIITALTIYYLSRNNIFSSLNQVKNIPWYGFVCIVFLVACYVLCDSFIIYNSFKHIDYDFSFSRSIGSYLYGNLGSNISPGKTGHYPMMLYNYEKNGVEIDKVLNSITQNQLVYSFDLVIMYFIVFLVCKINNLTLVLEKATIPLYIPAILGIITNAFFAVLVLLLAFCKPIRDIIIEICAFFLIKFKKIDSKKEYVLQEQYRMAIYKEQIIYFCKHFYKMIYSLLAYSIFVICYYGLPYFIYIFVNGSGFDFKEFFMFFAMYQAMTYVTNMIPVPGGSGVSEFAFLTVFSSVITDKTILGTTMIVWRLCTYYLLTIVDFIYVFVTTWITKKKKKEVKKNNIDNSLLNNKENL